MGGQPHRAAPHALGAERQRRRHLAPACDAAGGEHRVPRKQLQLIQEQLGTLIEHRVAASAKDWLTGATDLAVGMVILGLGFFMLMWVIATG